jgi:diaminopimelate epimerase
MKIRFTKAHGAHNDFLLSWAKDVPEGDVGEMAKALCDRYTGIGADGWMLVWPPEPGSGTDGRIRLYNSDGSDSEISGNGTRCAAAFLLADGTAKDEIRIKTGAGVKHLRVNAADGRHFQFRMNMGKPVLADGGLHFPLPFRGGTHDVTILDMGNPQCAVMVDDFDFDWRQMGKELEFHPHFPNRTNVSFVRKAGEQSIDVRFWERGAGETQSSGTGSSGAAAAAILLGLVKSPVAVQTVGGILPIWWDGTGDLFLEGPAVIIAVGEFFLS